MSDNKRIVYLAIGETGVGKSANGNAMLMRKVFDTCSSPEQCTTETKAKSSKVNGIDIYYIDTPGFTEDQNEEQVKMLEFLRDWKLGVNVLLILINAQNPRFTASVQKTMTLINKEFQNPEIWNQSAVIFTRCYQDCFHRDELQKLIKPMKKFIKTLPRCQNTHPLKEHFFVDSYMWEHDISTYNEYKRAFNFGFQFLPISSIQFKMIDQDFENAKEITIKNILTNYEVEEINNQIVVKYYYEDHKRKMILLDDGEISYSKPQTIRCYQKTENFNMNDPKSNLHTIKSLLNLLKVSAPLKSRTLLQSFPNVQ